MKRTSFDRQIADSLSEAVKNLDQFIPEHAAAMRHIYRRLSMFPQQDIDIRIRMAFSQDQPDQIRGMTAFEVICWYSIFKCYDQGSFYLNLDRLKEICDLDPSAIYMRAVYVDMVPSEAVYKSLKAQHPQSSKAYLEYCKHYFALKADKRDFNAVFGI